MKVSHFELFTLIAESSMQLLMTILVAFPKQALSRERKHEVPYEPDLLEKQDVLLLMAVSVLGH